MGEADDDSLPGMGVVDLLIWEVLLQLCAADLIGYTR